jgi:HNH endonuclease
MAKRTVEERFWARVQKTETCWLWIGADNGSGYGRFYPAPRQSVAAHRFAYELLVGPIPEGLQLDHLCRNPPCVNPAHLEPVTNRENSLRGISPLADNARKTHCPRGHSLLDPENVYRWPGYFHRRYCRTCNQLRVQEHRARNALPH